MLKRFLVVSLVALGAFALSVRGAEASIVDLDALVNDNSSPVPIFLLPGDYFVKPVSGTFQAWSKWDGSSCNSFDDCTQGFETSFWFSSPSLGLNHIGDGHLYQYAYQALENAAEGAFSILNPLGETVSFFITDAPLNDNRGGLSLDVASVPEPATLMLLGTGLFAAARRRYQLRRQQ